jgi:hypothetical protein
MSLKDWTVQDAQQADATMLSSTPASEFGEIKNHCVVEVLIERDVTEKFLDDEQLNKLVNSPGFEISSH